MSAFRANWEEAFITNTKEQLRTNTKIAYAERDMDIDLLQEEDLQELAQFITDHDLKYAGNTPLEVYKACSDFKKQRAHRSFKEAEHQYLNLANWLCMARKAPMMVEAFKEKILPRIKEVHSTQKHIKLENDSEDIVQGYIDMVVTLDDGKKYVLDLKTSARKYDENAANESPQLTLYAYHEGVEDIGFIVLYKNIAKDKTRVCTSCGKQEMNNRVKTCSNLVSDKRCGGELGEEVIRRAELDLILGRVNSRLAESVISNFDIINQQVKHGVFYKNFDSCSNWYGGDCPFKRLCFSGDDSGLICTKK